MQKIFSQANKLLKNRTRVKMAYNLLSKFVFLYGTLKIGEYNHYLLQRKENGVANFVQNAVTREKLPLVVPQYYTYPFLLNKPGTGNYVSGEIFEVDERMLQVLDRLESEGYLYDREVMTFNTLNRNETIDAFVYVLNRYPEKYLNLTMISEFKGSNVSHKKKKRSETKVTKSEF